MSNTGMLLVTVALLSLLSVRAQPTTLATELQKHGVAPAAPLDDLDREITSFAVASDESWFAIAYYWGTGNDLLPDQLRVRTLDRKTAKWRSAVLDREALGGGSAVKIARRPGVIYLDLHINPSAGMLVVLSEALQVRQRLYGGSSLILDDGRVFYENSVVHFAPAHAGSVSLYDPRSDRDIRVYPMTPDPATGPALMDREIGTIEVAGAKQVRIPIREQFVLLGPDNRAPPSGPVREVIVACDISKPAPVCVVHPQEKGRQN